jgi:hypothetical protein
LLSQGGLQSFGLRSQPGCILTPSCSGLLCLLDSALAYLHLVLKLLDGRSRALKLRSVPLKQLSKRVAGGHLPDH